MHAARRAFISAAGMAAVIGVATIGQTSAGGEQAAAGRRTADGQPDLQGVYDLATLTPLERPAALGTERALTDATAARHEREVAARRERADRPSDADRSAPPIGGDGSTGAAGNVGGYNSFWTDSGDRYVTIRGEKRSSIIIDPESGRLPPLLAAAAQRQAALRNRPGDAFDDPERRPLAERCLLGFGSTSGPPALPVLYNNLHQIVQTRDTVMILNEMNHDARIVRLNAEHLAPGLRRWMGDSIGRWDGETLVVDTTNFTEQTRFQGSSAALHVVERFSRLDARTLLYEFTVSDPSTWAQPWRGEYTWPETDDHLYEYACHEANYAMVNILSGARQRDVP